MNKLPSLLLSLAFLAGCSDLSDMDRQHYCEDLATSRLDLYTKSGLILMSEKDKQQIYDALLRECLKGRSAQYTKKVVRTETVAKPPEKPQETLETNENDAILYRIINKP